MIEKFIKLKKLNKNERPYYTALNSCPICGSSDVTLFQRVSDCFVSGKIVCNTKWCKHITEYIFDKNGNVSLMETSKGVVNE